MLCLYGEEFRVERLRLTHGSVSVEAAVAR